MQLLRESAGRLSLLWCRNCNDTLFAALSVGVPILMNVTRYRGRTTLKQRERLPNRVARGEAVMRIIMGVFLFLLALTCFVAAQLFYL